MLPVLNQGSGKHRRSTWKLKYPPIGETRDVDGHLWYVRQVRETKHGFDLLFGSPESRAEPFPIRLPRLIPTQSLQNFWEANKTRHDSTIYDLPAGRSTLKRVRRRLGFHVEKDTAKYWKKHIDDLRVLTATQVAAKHQMNGCVIRHVRSRLLGKMTREIGWWREPRVVNILLSPLTLREMGKKLGIGTSHAGRLRRRVLQERSV
ncbi:MAG TPA: hypothetical protein VH302_00860 [Bryobacteraceae bacterium]|nr:hypothetical protein [Bryobacteraceae bacterium]